VGAANDGGLSFCQQKARPDPALRSCRRGEASNGARRKRCPGSRTRQVEKRWGDMAFGKRPLSSCCRPVNPKDSIHNPYHRPPTAKVGTGQFSGGPPLGAQRVGWADAVSPTSKPGYGTPADDHGVGRARKQRPGKGRGQMNSLGIRSPVPAPALQ